MLYIFLLFYFHFQINYDMIFRNKFKINAIITNFSRIKTLQNFIRLFLHNYLNNILKETENVNIKLLKNMLKYLYI